MKLSSFLLISLICFVCSSRLVYSKRQQPQDDDEFSEFDNLDEDTPRKEPLRTSTQASFDDSSSIEEEDDEFESKPTIQTTTLKQESKKTLNDDLDMEEFEHFVDDEEFEGLSVDTSTNIPKSSTQKSKTQSSADSKSSMPSLKIADVPTHLISNGNWQNYIYEIVMLVVIFLYMIVFFYGKSKNYRLVNSWYQANRDLLEKNFSLVGDDGASTEISQNEMGTLIKESENSYGLWCSGRTACDGLLIQLKLIKRQDLINGFLMQLIKPQSDQIIFSVEYPSPEEIDSFVFCLTNKKISQQMFNDYQDLASFCVEKKTLPSSGTSTSYSEMLNTSVANKYVLLNEIGEVPSIVLDKSVCAFLNKYPDMVEYILVSDQYVGYKAQLNEEQSTNSPTDSQADNSLSGIPKSRSVLIVCFNIPGKGLNTTAEDMESMLPALQLALYLIDKVPRIRLSKEAKIKAIKKRKDLAEQYMKLTHKQRQEAAMLRKEEKRRAEKEKIMNESDPEKQKKLEEKELKREKKKNLSKMKQIKIKSM